jgi:hypothetical protein
MQKPDCTFEITVSRVQGETSRASARLVRPLMCVHTARRFPKVGSSGEKTDTAKVVRQMIGAN